MTTELSPEAKKVWNQVVAKAWADEAFKKRLLANPAAVLREHGLESSGKPKVQVVENTEDVVYLVLPSRQLEDLSEAELEKVAGGLRSAAGVSWACYTESR